MKLSQKTIDEINRHCDPKNMLVVNVAGIRRLRSPIKVRCLKQINFLVKDSIQEITAIKVTAEGQMLYLIGGKYLPYYYFEILVQ